MGTPDKALPAAGLKITVLVAVYNVEHFLPQCLGSLSRQTYGRFEAICIDDCSTDHSLQLLQVQAAADSRFRVLHLDRNQGQAHARNEGLKQATGDVITFLDSDDWLADDALEQLADAYRSHPLADSVLFRVMKVKADGSQMPYPMEPFDVMDGKKAFELSLDWSIHGWYALRAPLFHRYPYDESCRAYSDDNTTHLHYYMSRQVCCCAGIYYYRDNSESVTHAASPRRFDFLRATISMKQQLLDLRVDNRILDIYERQRWLILVDTCLFCYHHGRELRADDLREGCALIRSLWRTVEVHRLPWRLRWKFGYMPCRHLWPLFVAEERLYFWLRDLKYRRGQEEHF